eukprot:Protomagalhaensia_sp_Gyna_25__1936@NODE_2029_length_1337_cov_506_209553_g1674_i0_p1_GENE_NODE_2029_length_1337_cov_506_209553_g1674_i0NODE_2029_length_1337_cov_506_209553_g1674_i0_p1_ORF_typecomplete_len301_score16_49_NODE_2029_length_1337_cov_506_209553_g1674_i01211023
MVLLAYIIGIVAGFARAQLTAEEIAQIKQQWPYWNYDYSAVANLASFAPMTTNRTYTIHEYSCANACCAASCDVSDPSTFESCLTYMDTSCSFTATISVPIESTDFYCAFDNALWHMDEWPIGAQIEWDLKWMHPEADPFYMYLNIAHVCRPYYIGLRHLSDKEHNCEVIGPVHFPTSVSINNLQIQMNLDGFFADARGSGRAALVASCSSWDFNMNNYSGHYWFRLSTPGLKGVVYSLSVPSASSTTSTTTPTSISASAETGNDNTMRYDFTEKSIPDHAIGRLLLATSTVLSFLITTL